MANHTILVAKNGVERPIDDSAAPIKDEAGKMVGVVLTFRDVTQQREADRALREREQELRLVTDHAPAFLAHCDREGRYKFVNKGYAERFGMAPQDVVGRRIRDVLGEKAYANIARHVEAVLAGQPVEFEVEIPYERIGRHIMHAAYAPEFDASGRVEGFVAVITDVTERKRAEDALRASEQRFARFMQHLPGLAWIKDGQGRYVYANDAAASAFGTPQAELYGKTDDDVFPPETAERFKSNDARALSGGTIQVVEELEHDDGLVHYSLVCKFPLSESDGGVALVGGMAIDITDRKRAEEKVRHSEERFRSLMEQAPFSIQVFSPDGRTIRVNRAWEELWGLRFEQIDGYNVLEDRQLEAKGVLQYIHQGFAGQPTRIPAIEYNPNETIPDSTRQDDPRRWLSAVIYPLKDGEGRVREVVLIHEDITARKRAEEKSQRSEAQSRTILESITDAFCALDRDWRFTYVNRQAEVLLGRSRDDLIGKNHWEEYPDTLGTDVERNYRRAVAENVTVTFEFFYPPHDRWYECHAYPSPDGLSVYFRDVSERKRAETRPAGERAAVPPARRRHAADRLDRPTGRQHRLPEPPLDRVHRAAGDGGQRGLGADPAPRRRPACRRALGGVRARAARRSRWKCGSWIGASRPTAGISSEPWPSRTSEGKVARWFGTSTDIHEQKRAEESSRFLAEASADSGGRGGLRKHLAEGGEPGRPVLRRLVRRGRGGRRRQPAAAGGRPPGRRKDRPGPGVDAGVPARPAVAGRGLRRPPHGQAGDRRRDHRRHARAGGEGRAPPATDPVAGPEVVHLRAAGRLRQDARRPHVRHRRVGADVHRGRPRPGDGPGAPGGGRRREHPALPGAAGRRPPQGRVPGDAGPRTPQPAGPDPQRAANPQDAEGRCGDGRAVTGDDGAAGAASRAAGGRPAGRVPGHAGQDRTPQGAGRTRHGRRPCGRDGAAARGRPGA